MSYAPPPPGQPYGQQPPYVVPETSGKAITSLVLGILSLTGCSLFTGIPAMILGKQAKREIAESNGRVGGEGLAQAGFVTGLIGTVIAVLAALIVVAVFTLGAVVRTEFTETCEGTFADGSTTAQC